jgi:dsRNA-specific ribonuclease
MAANPNPSRRQQQQQQQQQPSPLSLLHPSYTAALCNRTNAANTSQPLSSTDRLANKLAKLPNGPFPYAFRDASWLAQAVTHVSVLGSVSYQRLEFLGDALLDLVVSLRTLARGRGEG